LRSFTCYPGYRALYQNFDIIISLNDYTGEYYLFTTYFENRQDTSNEIRKLRNKEVKDAEVFEMTTDTSPGNE